VPSLRFPSALDLKNAIIHYGESKVPLKSIVVFILFALLLVYFAFLNPNEVDIHLTQVYSLRLPMIALFFGCVLLGILIAGFLNWTLSIKTSLENAKEIRRRRHQEKIDLRSGKFFEKAESLVTGGSVSKAIPIYKKILKLSPGHLGALNRLGNVLQEEGNPQRALELHLRAAEIAPDNLEVLYSLADDYAAMAMNAEEMETLEKILKLDQNSPRPLYRLRATHLKTGDWALVSDVQKKLISRVEDTEKREREKKLLSQYICNNGMRYFSNDNLEAAVPEFKRAIREDARCLPAYIVLGDIYVKTGNKKMALKTWKSGYENTRSPVCLVRMEKLQLELNQAEEMIRFYEDAIRASQNSCRETLCLLLGVLCLEQDNPEEAIRTIEDNSGSEKSLLHSLLLAEAYRKQRNEKHSQETLQLASNQVRNAILKFECDQCGGTLTEWAVTCPRCGTFGGVTCRSGIQVR
jgi:lipopolysaccharide biosynthesis regulator YciM